MKDKDLAFSEEDLKALSQRRITEKLLKIDNHLCHLSSLVSTLSDQVYTVSGLRVELESSQEEMGNDNIMDSLSVLQHNASLLTSNLQRCLSSLSESL